MPCRDPSSSKYPTGTEGAILVDMPSEEVPSFSMLPRIRVSTTSMRGVLRRAICGCGPTIATSFLRLVG
jgi:hypothetical protein